MFLITAAAIAASTPPDTPLRSAGAVVQARATVRILSGVGLRQGEEPSGDTPPVRQTAVKTDGILQPARLIEFE